MAAFSPSKQDIKFEMTALAFPITSVRNLTTTDRTMVLNDKVALF